MIFMMSLGSQFGWAILAAAVFAAFYIMYVDYKRTLKRDKAREEFGRILEVFRHRYTGEVSIDLVKTYTTFMSNNLGEYFDEEAFNVALSKLETLEFEPATRPYYHKSDILRIMKESANIKIT
jgi:hypothetical protein